MKRLKRHLLGLAVLPALLAGVAGAQEYPVKPVRLIVPFAAGGPNDLAIRPLTGKLQEYLGQPFVIDYRAGANGVIGTDYVAKSPPDGYTLLVISASYTINVAMSASLPFDPLKDLTAVSSIATSDIVLVVNPSVPARTVKEFVALAKARPGKMTYGSSGTGGSLHMGAVLLAQVTGIDMVHVPYKGAILSLTDVMGGHVDSMFIAASAAIPHIQSGRVRALGVTSKRRAPSLPDVPTFAEAGYPAVQVDSSYAVLAPGATPREVINKLNAAIGKALGTPDVQERYAAQGLVAAPTTPQDYQAYLRDDMAKWRKVVAAGKLQAQ